MYLLHLGYYVFISTYSKFYMCISTSYKNNTMVSKEEEFKPIFLEALSIQCGYPIYTINPFKGEFKPKKSLKERYSKKQKWVKKN